MPIRLGINEPYLYFSNSNFSLHLFVLLFGFVFFLFFIVFSFIVFSEHRRDRPHMSVLWKV